MRISLSTSRTVPEDRLRVATGVPAPPIRCAGSTEPAEKRRADLCSNFGIAGLGAIPGVAQHPSKVDHLLRVDVLVSRDVKNLGLRSENNDVFTVVPLSDRGNGLQERENRMPLDVVACRMLKDRGQSASV